MDRISKEDFKAALHKMYSMSKKEKAEIGKKGAEHVNKNYNFEDFNERWIELMDHVYEKYGSWSNRKNYKSWTFEEAK